MIKYFCMPADFKKETIDRYDSLNKSYCDSKVIETYGNVTLGADFGSGRVKIQLPDADLLDLKDYVEYSFEKGIDFNYTLNAPFMGNREFTSEGIAKLKGFLKNLYEMGIRSLTVAMPSIINLIRNLEFDFKIKASTICNINNVNKALGYQLMGVDRIVVDESIHRDFDHLKRIVQEFNGPVEMIVNTMCHKNCLYRHFHYNEAGGHSIGTANEVGVNFFEHRCMLQRYNSIGELLKLAWIRPEDLKYYMSIGINHFKMQGRQHVLKGDPIKALECYIKEDFDGNLMELLDMFNTRYNLKLYLDNKKLKDFVKPFYENRLECKKDCSECSYCETFAKKCIDEKDAKKTIIAAKEFYQKYDRFKELIQSQRANIEGKNYENDDEIKFQLDE